MVDKEGMEKLARIAKAHHKAASREIKNAADEFCRSVFRQAGNGHSLSENDFLAVMMKKGFPQYADRDLFRMLQAKDGNHHMTMSEALTLYYVVLSGRPFCSSCEHFIPDMFFCCSKCPAAKYALCLGCYESEAYLRHKRNKHVGENDVFFLDYTVLHTGCYSAAPTPQSPNLQTHEDKGKELVATFSTVLTACTAALNFGAAFCTIM
nr:Ca2+ sensor (EF-Hand superfamily) [Ipomoea batatas]